MEHSHILLNIEEQKSPTHLPAPHPLLKRLLLLFSSTYLKAVIILLFLHWSILHSIAYSHLYSGRLSCFYLLLYHHPSLFQTSYNRQCLYYGKCADVLHSWKSRAPLSSIRPVFGLGALFSWSPGLPFWFYFSLFSCS